VAENEVSPSSGICVGCQCCPLNIRLLHPSTTATEATTSDLTIRKLQLCILLKKHPKARKDRAKSWLLKFF